MPSSKGPAGPRRTDPARPVRVSTADVDSPPRRRPARVTAVRRPRTRLPGPNLVIAVLSTLVLALTGYGWTSFRALQQGLSTADVIGFSAPDGSVDILLVGNDSRTDAQGDPLPRDVLARLHAGGHNGELTDTIILVRVPNDGSRAVAISLPRDLYVELPDGFGRHKLNSAYARAKNETTAQLVEAGADAQTVRTESISAGRKLLLRTVEDLTGVGIDHYAEINLLGFSLLTEAVGGVEICLREPVKDPFSGADFPAGQQTISGPEALAFVRQRHGLPRGDLDRVVRQQVFLASLAEQMMSAGTLSNPKRLSELVDATQQSLVLDEDLDILDFTARIRGIAAGNVEFLTVPVLGDAHLGSEGTVLKVDPQAVQAFAEAAIGTDLSAAPSTPPTTKITVDVLNSSGVTGLAAAVAKKLTAQGYIEGTVRNADPRILSVVRYPTDRRDMAQTVADLLGGLPTEEDPNLPPGTVQVYLGEDYSGPAASGIGATRLVQLDGRPAAPAPGILGEAPSATPTPSLVGGDVPCVH